MAFKRRNLPHFGQGSEEYFVTYRQHGTWVDAGVKPALVGLLDQPEVAKVIMDDWFFRDRQAITLHAVCIMRDHVHAVFTLHPGQSLFQVMRSHKGITAQQVNRILGRQGQFWQTEYFDRILREGKLPAAVHYTLQNPVKAGLVSHWREWPYSFLAPKDLWMFENAPSQP